MVKYKLKKNVLVKVNFETGALVLSLDKDQIYQFTGDSSLAIKILSDFSFDTGLTQEELKAEVSKVSENFKTNESQDQCLEEFFSTLKDLSILETQ